MTHTESHRVIVSYLTHRRLVGLLGCALPLVVAVWGAFLPECGALQETISHYYDFRTRDAFVGILFAIAWFLFTYRGYDKRDATAGTIACVCALGVALFPHAGSNLERAVHYTSAATLLLTLAYFSLFLFTISSDSPTDRKRIRNRIYRACGIAIVVCVALIGIIEVFPPSARIATLKPVFWLESIALWAFGFSWFVKGNTLWKDTAA